MYYNLHTSENRENSILESRIFQFPRDDPMYSITVWIFESIVFACWRPAPSTPREFQFQIPELTFRVLVAHRTPNRVYGVCVVNFRLESQGFEPVNPKPSLNPDSGIASVLLLVFRSSQFAENSNRESGLSEGFCRS